MGYFCHNANNNINAININKVLLLFHLTHMLNAITDDGTVCKSLPLSCVGQFLAEGLIRVEVVCIGRSNNTTTTIGVIIMVMDLFGFDINVLFTNSYCSVDGRKIHNTKTFFMMTKIFQICCAQNMQLLASSDSWLHPCQSSKI